MTTLVFRRDGREWALNTLPQAVKAEASVEYFDWHFQSRNPEITVSGRISASARQFVGLTYYNPPGGSHTCLNTKLARCELHVKEPGSAPLSLSSEHGAAFEIITPDTNHGIHVAV